MTHKKKKLKRLVKGSKEAKAYMRRLRASRKGIVLTRKGKKGKLSTRKGIVLTRKVSGKVSKTRKTKKTKHKGCGRKKRKSNDLFF